MFYFLCTCSMYYMIVYDFDTFGWLSILFRILRENKRDAIQQPVTFGMTCVENDYRCFGFSYSLRVCRKESLFVFIQYALPTLPPVL